MIEDLEGGRYSRKGEGRAGTARADWESETSTLERPAEEPISKPASGRAQKRLSMRLYQRDKSSIALPHSALLGKFVSVLTCFSALCCLPSLVVLRPLVLQAREHGWLLGLCRAIPGMLAGLHYGSQMA